METKKKCWECGSIATHRIEFDFETKGEYITTAPEDFRFRCYCESCAEKVEKQHKEEFETYIRLKKRMMFYKALTILEKQNAYMYKLKEAIDVVEEHLTKNPDKYDSSYEVLASIILVHNRIYSKRQYKIGKYMVDFFLPEHGVVLEIDGERHKYQKGHDQKRDEYIKKELGPGWNIIRIKTEYLDQKAEKLPEAINAVVEYRQKCLIHI